MKRKIYLGLLLLIVGVLSSYAQRADYSKMSAFVRQTMLEHAATARQLTRSGAKDASKICAFVRIKGDAEEVMRLYDCTRLADFGDIYIVDIPLRNMAFLSKDKRVQRIEAGQGTSIATDSVALQINALPAYAGEGLPQAYTGKGVVLGIQDIGFDLTHPTFYDTAGKNYRIKRFWDHLSTDTLMSTLYVGAAYTDSLSILGYQHSRDGLEQTHGTHTLGTAAGSGYNTKYRGIAYESDLCVVANATGNNIHLIDKDNRYKHTYATDALGFKYMMDYAESVNKPCVISFSEGSKQDFSGDDMLYYEVLQQLTGPGRIIVAAAGNNGNKKSYLLKDKGQPSAGTFMTSPNKTLYTSFKSRDNFDIRVVTYGTENDSVVYSSNAILSRADSSLVDTLEMGGREVRFHIAAYPSSFDNGDVVIDVLMNADNTLGQDIPLSVEVVGQESKVEMFNVVGEWVSNALNPLLAGGDNRFSVFSPGSAPAVICVGATSYRTTMKNSQGNTRVYHQGVNGERAGYSSVGPTFDLRVKPDVMAPGTNIISSLNSFYLENKPTGYHSVWSVAPFEWNGRTYAWSYDAGTSMATPAVAGAIALWLQANPKLTPDEVKSIFAKTCVQHDASATYPNNQVGYGQIDVYRGLLEILQLTSVEGLSQHQPQGVQIQPLAGRQLRLSFGDEKTKAGRVRIYTVGGACVAEYPFLTRLSDYHIDLSHLPIGVYAVQVVGNSRELTGSTLIRL